jgi:choice-of-anchor A domain-containing protein
VGAGTNCTTPLLGDAQPFGTFIVGHGNVNDINVNNARFGGRVAVNGSAIIDSFEIGLGLNCSAATANADFTLIVAGDLNATNGELTCGTFLVGGTVISPPGLSGSAASGRTGDVLAQSGLDFAATSADLESVSLALCAQANATRTSHCMTLVCCFMLTSSSPSSSMQRPSCKHLA